MNKSDTPESLRMHPDFAILAQGVEHTRRSKEDVTYIRDDFVRAVMPANWAEYEGLRKLAELLGVEE